MVEIPDELIKIEYERLKEKYDKMNRQEQHAECIEVVGSLYEIEFLLCSCGGDARAAKLRKEIGISG